MSTVDAKQRVPEDDDPGAMILINTNVLIYASSDRIVLPRKGLVPDRRGVSEDGVAVNAVSLAEICVGDAELEAIADRIRSWSVTLLDVPAAAAELCVKSRI